MKIFDRNGKVNFVDDNNVLVGFDYWQICVENFGYVFTQDIPTEITDSTTTLEVDPDGFQFDCDFFQEGLIETQTGAADRATFRLTNGDAIAFLTLYNAHNGYYAHGFEMTQGNDRLREGDL